VTGDAYTIGEYSMTKQELAQKVAADAGIAGGQAKSAVDAAFDAIANELVAGRDVAIAVSGRPARDGATQRAARRSRSPPVPSQSSQLPRR
jgi:nucleoid DNA-binding protein